MSFITLANIGSIRGLSCPQQYAELDGVLGFYIVLKNRLYKNLQNRLDLIPQISWQYQGDNNYLGYYYDNVFGFPRSFGETLIRTLWDDNNKWDDAKIWDDSNFVGLLDLTLYKVLIKWFLSYSEETFSSAWICGLIQDFCKVDSQGYTITKSMGGILVTMARTTRSSLLQRVFLKTDIYDNIPIETITFNLTT